MSFCLGKCIKIGLYGYTNRAKYIGSLLKEIGIEEIFFIDQNAKNITNENVYTLKEIIKKNHNQLEAISIIISLQSAVLHSKIAEIIHDAGINKIIFLPIGTECSLLESVSMRRYYNDLINGYINMEEEIYSYNEIVKKGVDYKKGIIYQNKRITTFWAHVNNIYVNDYSENITEINKEYYGKPLAVIDHYQALFKYFQEGKDNESLRKYVQAQNYQKKDGTYDEKKLEERYELWNNYKVEFNRGMEFFISSAPEVSINKVGGFNIKDGLHRTIFLYLQELIYIPVTLKTEIFDYIYSKEKLAQVIQYMNEKRIRKLRTPIEHPAFYQFPCEKENREPSVLRSIQQYIGTIETYSWNILDISDYNSYFARIMSRRMKSEEGYICSVETELQWYELAKKINELLNVQNVDLIYKDKINDLKNKNFHLVFALGRWSGDNYSPEIIALLDKITEGMLFWESHSKTADGEVKKILENTSFNNQKLLFQYYDGIDCKKVYVLEK